jgi:hypothetical protein
LESAGTEIPLKLWCGLWLEIVGEAVWERFNANKKEQQWYYVELYNAFEQRKDFIDQVYESLVKELANRVSTYLHCDLQTRVNANQC